MGAAAARPRPAASCWPAGAGGGALSAACPFPHGLGCCGGGRSWLLQQRPSLTRSWLWPGQLPRSLGVGQGDGPAQVPTVVVKMEATAAAGGPRFGS
jgi:hypothetical protein